MEKKAVVLRVEWRTDQRGRDWEWGLAREKSGEEDLGGFWEEAGCSYEVLSGPFCLSKGPGARRGEEKKRWSREKSFEED